MQTSSGSPKTASQLSQSVRQHLNRYALAKVLVGVGLIVLAWPAEAKVVYTPVNVTISGNGSIKIDLNHDGITDFVLRSVSQVTVCGNRGGLIGSTKITPTIGDGVVVSHLNFAAVLGSGIPIDARATFYNARTVVTQFFICSSGSQHVAGYLGLEFQINGRTHYGWAQVDIYAFYNFRGHVMRTTLVAFAYETIPGQAIKTGQTSGAADDPTASPDSANPEDSGPTSSVVDPHSTGTTDAERTRWASMDDVCPFTVQTSQQLEARDCSGFSVTAQLTRF